MGLKTIISTQRLTLREASIDDANFILQLLNSDGWIKYIGDRNIKTIGDAENYIKSKLINSYQEHGYGMYVVMHNKLNIPIGQCGLINRPTLDDVDIGYAVLSDYYKQGYTEEAAKAVLDYAFNTLHLKKIVAITIPSNLGSIRVLEKIGLRFDSEMDDDEETVLLYSIER